MGQLPRVKASTQGEGHERRYFYGSVWAVAIAQPMLWLMWKVAAADGYRGRRACKLVVFVGILAFVGNLARLGLLAAHPADRARRIGRSRLSWQRLAARGSTVNSADCRG